jgi:type I restriction enzyme S subunit
MTSRASIGFAAIAVEDICTNQGFQSLRCGKALDNWFALHQIRHRRAELQQLAAGSTFLEVSGSNIRSFPFVIPPLPEQKKIAEILSGIDTAINKIATAIVKSDTALTGIFAELDLIAAAGKISTLGEIARVQNGYAFQSSIFTEDSAGIPLVRISNISGGLVDTSKSKRIPQTLAALGEYKVSRGDILIAMSGATTGKIGIYHGSSFCLLNQRVGKFVFRPGSKSIAYATQLLLSGFLESRILAKAAGGAQPNISGKGIEAIEIPFPDTAEQDKYAITIQEFLRVNAKRRILMEKYQHLKSALSSDLLSGRKRVSI